MLIYLEKFSTKKYSFIKLGIGNDSDVATCTLYSLQIILADFNFRL